MPWWIWSLPLLLVALVVYRLARAAPAYSHHVGLDDVDDLEIALRASGHEPRRDGGSKCGEVRHTLSVSLSGATSDLARNGARLITLTARALCWPENVRITAHIERT